MAESRHALLQSSQRSDPISQYLCSGKKNGYKRKENKSRPPTTFQDRNALHAPRSLQMVASAKTRKMTLRVKLDKLVLGVSDYILAYTDSGRSTISDTTLQPSSSLKLCGSVSTKKHVVNITSRIVSETPLSAHGDFNPRFSPIAASY